MYHQIVGSWAAGWDWFWIGLVALLWIAVVAAPLVYAAARVVLYHEHQSPGAPRA